MSKKKKKKLVEVADQGVRPSGIVRKRRSFPKQHLLAFGLIMIIALVAYGNAFHVPFQFDDRPNILDNPGIQIKTFTFGQIEQLIQNTYKENLRLFSFLTFGFNYYIGRLNPFGYHLVNLLIHMASGIFLYWFLFLTFNLPSLKERYGSSAFPIALYSSLLFVSHPIQTQSVTYIVQRMTSLAGMFCLLSMLLYVKGRLSKGKERLLSFTGAFISYFLGIFSKENAAILLLFIGLYEFYFFQNFELNIKRNRIFTYVTGSILIAGTLFLLFWGKGYLHYIAEGYKTLDFTLTERLLTQSRVVLFYITLLVYPHPSRLNLDHDFLISRSIFDPPMTLLSMAIIAGLIAYSLWTAKKRPLLSFFILWYFGNLLIESSVFPLELIYEHRLYLPSVGPFVLFSIFVVKGWEKVIQIRRQKAESRKQEAESRRQEIEVRMQKAGGRGQGVEGKIQEAVGSRQKAVGKIQEAEGGRQKTESRRQGIENLPLWIFIVLSSSLLCVACYHRNSIWRSEVALWEDCLKKSPNKARIHNNLGISYYNVRRYTEAVEAFQRAIRLKPDYPDACNNLGLAYKALASYPEAIEAFQKAIRAHPDFSAAIINLGATWTEMGQPERATDTLEKAMQFKPNDAGIANNLGTAYRKMGRYQEAIKAYQEAIRLRPDYSDAYSNLGLTYLGLGEHREAIEILTKASQQKPADAEIYNNLGVAFRKIGRPQEAIEAYQKAIQLKPEDPQAYNNLGLAYHSLGQYREATKAFKNAILLKPNNEEFHYNLGVTYSTLGDHPAGIESYKEALALKQDHTKARFNLGLSYVVLKRLDLALKEYEVLKSLDADRAKKLLSLIHQEKGRTP